MNLHRSPKTFRLAAAVLAGIMLAGACGSDDESSEEDGDEGAESSETASVTEGERTEGAPEVPEECADPDRGEDDDAPAEDAEEPADEGSDATAEVEERGAPEASAAEAISAEPFSRLAGEARGTSMAGSGMVMSTMFTGPNPVKSPSQSA